MTRLSNFFRFKDKVPLTYTLMLFSNSRAVDAMLPVVAKLADTQTLDLVSIQAFHLQPKKRSKTKTTTAIKDHMLLSVQVVSIEDFTILASIHSYCRLKIKERLLIVRDKPESNRNKKSLLLYLFD